MSAADRDTWDWTEFDAKRKEARSYPADSPTPFRDAEAAYRAAG